MTTRPVVVVGDVGLDVITRPSGEIHWHSDTPSAVDARCPAGPAATPASWLAAASGRRSPSSPGSATTRPGRTCRHELEAAGVACAFAVDDSLPTCMVVILLDAHGDRTMFPDRGANKAFSVADVDLASLGLPAEPLPHLHLSGYVLFDAGSRAAGLESLRQARALGWTTSVDPQSPALIAREGAEVFLGWVDGVDLLLPNESEVAALGGLGHDPRPLRRGRRNLRAGGARWVGKGVEESADAPGRRERRRDRLR